MWPRLQSRTELETLLDDSDGKRVGLATDLVPSFDSYAGLQYLRRGRALRVQFDVPQGPPSDDWIISKFSALVRDEFGNVSREAPTAPPEPNFRGEVSVDSGAATLEYLASCERDLVFNGVVQAIARHGGESVVDKLYALLTHPLVGNSANRRHLSLEEFRNLVSERVANNQRLTLIFPGFPFKDQNPFRTLNEASDPDLCEAAMLAKLHTLSTAIYQVYHMGAEWIVLSDGAAFSSSLRVTAQDCEGYFERIRQVRNFLDVGQAVSIIDFASIRRFLDADDLWEQVISTVQVALGAALPYEASVSLESLVRGMKRNVNLKDLRDGLSWLDWWSVLNWPLEDCRKSLHDKWLEVDDVARTSAIAYASFNLGTKWFNLEQNIFPEAIRATVHAKPGQIAVPQLGSEFPWNGVALVRDGRIAHASLECVPLRHLTERGLPITRYVSESGSTFYTSLG